MGVCLGWAGALGGVMWRRVKLGSGLGERARGQERATTTGNAPSVIFSFRELSHLCLNIFINL